MAFIAAVALNSSTLLLDEGDRVVAIINRDIERRDDAAATHLHSLGVWRGALRTVGDLSAWRPARRNVTANGYAPVSIPVAEVTASAFRVARVTPVQGRTFTSEDEREGAPDVVIIGYELWQRFFDGRPDILGATLQLGMTPHTVIGVMPEGFAFPFNNQLWTPLRLNATAYEAGNAPSVTVFARLAPGASLDDAQRELATVAPRIGDLLASRGEYIRPVVMPYARAFLRGTIEDVEYGSLARRAQVVVILLLSVIATNIALLVYARTASRAGEIAVRTALGASRARIVAQLFMEALVLSGVGSIVGLMIAHVASRRAAAMIQLSYGEVVPYWIHLGITPGVALYAAGLAVLSAIVIGVVPGLKATRDRVSQNLREVSRNTSMRLGRTWTALLVTQVAISVAVLPVAQGGAHAWLSLVLADFASPVTSNTVIAGLELDNDVEAVSPSAEVRRTRQARFAASVEELGRRLEEMPGVRVFRMSPAPDDREYMQIDVDTAGRPNALSQFGRTVQRAHVEGDYFSALGIRLLAGRTFAEVDAAPNANAIIVNRAFTEWFFGSENVLGRRVRLSGSVGADGVRQESREPWWEIVGVVEDYPIIPTSGPRPRVYRPLRAEVTYPIVLAVQAPGLDPSVIAERVRTAAVAVDPRLRLGAIRSLEDRLEDGIKATKVAIFGLVMVIVSVVLLSTAGIYALMSFTVTRRRREIGIRSALGAKSGRVLAGILSRALWQLGIGVAIGAVGAPIIAALGGDSSTPRELIVNGLVLIVTMVVVGLLATIGPARRALRVHPTEALRAE